MEERGRYKPDRADLRVAELAGSEEADELRDRWQLGRGSVSQKPYVPSVH
jgi:hypothetical protein